MELQQTAEIGFLLLIVLFSWLTTATNRQAKQVLEPFDYSGNITKNNSSSADEESAINKTLTTALGGPDRLKLDEEELVLRSSLCVDHDEDKFRCLLKEPRCTFIASSNNKCPSTNYADTAKDCITGFRGTCEVNLQFIKSLAQSQCRLESKASLIALAKDLHIRGIITNSVLNHLKVRQDLDLICRVIIYSYFSDYTIRQQIVSELDNKQPMEDSWNNIGEWEKIYIILDF